MLLVSRLGLLGLAIGANTRTIETQFALSSDARSDFSAGFQVFSAGRIVIEGSRNVQQGGAYRTLLVSRSGLGAKQARFPTEASRFCRPKPLATR